MGYKDVARACQEYIDANLDKELTLESIANALSFSTIYLRRCFQEDLPIIKINLPTTVAGYILHRAEAGHSGLALWYGYDFSVFNPDDFSIASPEGGAEVGLWTEIDGERCYLFGVTCRPDATIPESMVLHTLPPVTWAMFPVPSGANTHELFENLNAALAGSIEHCGEAATYEPITGQPCMEYYHGSEVYLCIPVRETRKG